MNGDFNTATSAVETSSSITIPTTYVQKATSLSNNDLVFTVLENSSLVLQAGQLLTVSFNLFNTLDSTNNVTGADNWQLTDQSEQNSWNCAQNDVFRIEVINGYYSYNNYSGGTPLDVFPFQSAYAGLNQCLLYIRAAGGEPITDQNYGQNYYIFNPKSNVAQWETSGIYTTCNNSCTRTANGTVVGECNPCNKINQTAVMNETMMLNPSLFANSTGVFTVIGGDEWGQILVLHFVVEQITTATISNSPSATSNPNSTASIIPSDVNASDACSAWVAYNNALGNGNEKNDTSFQALISNIESYPAFNALEGNRSGLYQYGGGGCGTNGLSLMFYYTDYSHPFTVCGNGSSWPQYQIDVGIYLAPNGYDLSRSNFTSIYHGPTNTTIDCTTNISSTNG